MTITNEAIAARQGELMNAYRASNEWSTCFRFVARRELEREAARPEDVEAVRAVIRDAIGKWCAGNAASTARDVIIARAIIAAYGPLPAPAPMPTGLTAEQEAMSRDDKLIFANRLGGAAASLGLWVHGSPARVVIEQLARLGELLCASAATVAPVDPVAVGMDAFEDGYRTRNSRRSAEIAIRAALAVQSEGDKANG